MKIFYIDLFSTFTANLNVPLSNNDHFIENTLMLNVYLGVYKLIDYRQ